MTGFALDCGLSEELGAISDQLHDAARERGSAKWTGAKNHAGVLLCRQIGKLIATCRRIL